MEPIWGHVFPPARKQFSSSKLGSNFEGFGGEREPLSLPFHCIDRIHGMVAKVGPKKPVISMGWKK